MTHNISFQWEQNIPFVDWMIIPYMSFNLLFIIPIFLLDKEQIRNLSYECTISTIFSGIIFFIFPVKLLFAREIPNGIFNKIYEYLFIIDQPQNLFPSLHIMYSLLLLLNCFKNIKSLLFRILFLIWILIIMLSTLFTHQHHILDVITGILCASIIFYIIDSKYYLKFYQYLKSC